MRPWANTSRTSFSFRWLLAGGGSFVTGPLSLHTTTNIDVIRRFLDVDIAIRSLGDGRFEMNVSR